MSLRERFPEAFRDWEQAGGIDANFGPHLIATGRQPADHAGLLAGLSRLRSATAEIEAIVGRLALAPVAPAPVSTALIHAIDVSSHQPTDLTGLLAGLEPRPTHVVVRLYQPLETPPQEHSLAQIESARANGCTVGAYLWLYASADPGQQVRDVLALAARANLRVPVLWLDIEPYTDGSVPDTHAIWQAIGEARGQGARPGIYTGAWVWPTLGSPTEFAAANVPLWLANYNGRPDLDVPLFGGWQRVSGHQWQGDPLDRDVFRPEVT